MSAAQLRRALRDAVAAAPGQAEVVRLHACMLRVGFRLPSQPLRQRYAGTAVAAGHQRGGGGRGHNPTSSHAVHRSREGWPALHITWFRGSMARPGQVVGGAQVKSHGAAGRALRAAGGGGGACRPTLTPPPSLTQRAQHSRRNICVGVRLGGVVSTIACKGRHHPRCSHEG